MLGNINSKFKNAKAAIKKKTEELNLKKLKDGVFPYACLVADDVMLTKNGTDFDIAEYATATVNVPNPSTGSLEITSNDTYDVTNYAQVVVNVGG